MLWIHSQRNKKIFTKRIWKKKNDFDIEVAIINAIIYHNNRVLSSTGYKPNDIRNTADDKIIQEVTNNIMKSMKRKVDKYSKCPENTLLLITYYTKRWKLYSQKK